ncbi:hypothetical protein BZL30_5346 [Mycobacterium kansasii]|uniref:Uncharacterized protein n=2 Tax=Mycobacterium kansasii TaxID=1768 RepID=A0A1V3X0A9_MYCKA|nr:hypothetical protein MKAN_04445 [Mycobacterium kansasii ATCC 12478]OOK72246.1 hypothetical protein BZL30_5346 [Mycobacterium kansasii]
MEQEGSPDATAVMASATRQCKMLLRILLGRPSLKWTNLVEALTCTLGKTQQWS